MRVGIAALVVVALGVVMQAQNKPVLVTLPRTAVHELTSKVDGRNYRLYVSMPEAYAKDSTTRFPVVYVTDADLVFGLAVQSYTNLQIGNEMPDALFVGIAPAVGYDSNSILAARYLELTPTRVLDDERSGSKRVGREVRTGGGPDFLRVLREELIPDVERRYRTTNDRTYIGYSLGGLFGAYALFHSPETFKRMILVSPSLFYDDGLMAKDEERYAADHKSLPVRLFMSVGELETDRMVGSMKRLAQALMSRHYEGLDLHTRIFEGESHPSTFPVAVTRGLKTVFENVPKP